MRAFKDLRWPFWPVLLKVSCAWLKLDLRKQEKRSRRSCDENRIGIMSFNSAFCSTSTNDLLAYSQCNWSKAFV